MKLCSDALIYKDFELKVFSKKILSIEIFIAKCMRVIQLMMFIQKD